MYSQQLLGGYTKKAIITEKFSKYMTIGETTIEMDKWWFLMMG